MPKVTLDMNTFKALASDTRLDILKALDGKRLNLKDICNATNLNKATLHEHLTKLNEAGLIKKYEREGHKWVYYKLTWKGEGLLHPENTRIVVLFSTTIISLIIAIVSFISFIKGKIVVNLLPGGPLGHISYDSENGGLGFVDSTLGEGARFMIKSIGDTDCYKTLNLNPNTQSLAFQTSQVNGKLVEDMNYVAQNVYNTRTTGAWASATPSTGEVTSVVHNLTLQYIAFACIAICIILLSIAIWRRKKNKNSSF